MDQLSGQQLTTHSPQGFEDFRRLRHIGLLLIGCGSVILGNWLFLGGGLPKYAGFGSAMMIVVGVIILWEDISEWWAGR